MVGSMRVREGHHWEAGAREAADSSERINAFLWKVYAWMSVGLGITGLVGLSLAALSVNDYGAGELALTELGRLLYSPMIRFGSLIVALVLVFVLAGLRDKLGPVWGAALFLVYSAVNGVWTSIIFLEFTVTSVGVTFLVTGGTFAATSLFGYATGRDLTKVGSLAFMGLIGIILASVVNIFLASPILYWIITYVGIAVFIGLIAWDTQRLKQIAADANDERSRSVAAIQGALVLYLDFLNLFLLLLNLFGRRR